MNAEQTGKNIFTLFLQYFSILLFSYCIAVTSIAIDMASVNSFQPTVAFHIACYHLFWSVKQATGFYMKRSTGLKWVNDLVARNKFDLGVVKQA